MNSRTLRVIRRVVTHRWLWIILVTFIAISEFGPFPPLIEQGYFCDDRSIQHPFNGDTVATTVLLISGLMPLLLIWIAELLFYVPPSSLCVRTDVTSTRCSKSWQQCWFWFKKYGRTLIIKLLIVDFLKILSGEHRPHFIDTCKPDVICEGNEYVYKYTCTNTEFHRYFIRDASKSFPSGHSSVSVYTSVFMIWYLQKRTPKTRSVMALPLCQISVALWGIFCSMSRIIDNRHHWWDVLAGSIIGIVAACLTCTYSCHNFDRTKLKPNQSTGNEHDMNLVTNNKHFMTTNGLHNTANS